MTVPTITIGDPNGGPYARQLGDGAKRAQARMVAKALANEGIPNESKFTRQQNRRLKREAQKQQPNEVQQARQKMGALNKARRKAHE